MATHDYIISNASGAAVRSDLNNALAAIVSNNSSATEPATTYAYMWWADTTAGQLKIRNAANDGWVTLLELDGTSLMEDGTVSLPGLAFASDLNTGFFRPGADQLAIATNGIERVEFGTTEVVFNDGGEDIDFRIEGDTNANLFFVDAGNDQVGIGTSPSTLLHLKTTGFTGDEDLVQFSRGIYEVGKIRRSSGEFKISGEGNLYLEADYNNNLGGVDSNILLTIDGSERARIDSSGRLLVGTTSASSVSTSQYSLLKLQGNTSSATTQGILNIARGSASSSGLGAGADIGVITFTDNAGNGFAQIVAAADATTGGANGNPGRLVFATESFGSDSGPVERMRITNAGHTIINTTDVDATISGTPTKPEFSFKTGSYEGFRFSSNGVNGYTNRAGDGAIIVFRSDGTDEGSITVSGTTVSYNGAHLSRWSQLPSGAEREEILRGTVLSNIDEMCEWGEEENEQLNRMQVSDVEGDKNVAGVFQSWDDDDDTYTNDFYCAMTGDFVIRIAQGVTVERGDLLMSAGDGTAKPQDDDIIRSKTIAKVTSTNVSCTYDDGSYCVPCVLMAC